MQFAKVQACGNDFLIVEAPLRSESDQELAKKLCQRHTGIGADGVEFLEVTGPLSGRIRLAIHSAGFQSTLREFDHDESRGTSTTVALQVGSVTESGTLMAIIA